MSKLSRLSQLSKISAELGVDLDPEDYDGVETLGEALCQGAYVGESRVVSAALKAGVDPSFKGRNGSALERAAVSDRHEVIEILLAAGADKDARSGDGKTALMTAAWFGALRSVQALLRGGADPQARCALSRSALHYACQDGLYGESAALCEGGGWNEALDDLGRSPLDIAIGEGSPQLALMLAKRGSLGALERSLERWALSRSSMASELEAIEQIKIVVSSRKLAQELSSELRSPDRGRQSRL